MRNKEVVEAKITPEGIDDQDSRDLFEMANLYPNETGLPMTVWVSPRGNARHDVRVKVNTTHGNQMNIANTAVVGVRPTPRLIGGRLSSEDTQAVFTWVRLNTDTLVAYWNGQIGTIEMAQALKPLPVSAQGQTGKPAIGMISECGLVGCGPDKHGSSVKRLGVSARWDARGNLAHALLFARQRLGAHIGLGRAPRDRER